MCYKNYKDLSWNIATLFRLMNVISLMIKICMKMPCGPLALKCKTNTKTIKSMWTNIRLLLSEQLNKQENWLHLNSLYNQLLSSVIPQAHQLEVASTTINSLSSSLGKGKLQVGKVFLNFFLSRKSRWSFWGQVSVVYSLTITVFWRYMLSDVRKFLNEKGLSFST